MMEVASVHERRHVEIELCNERHNSISKDTERNDKAHAEIKDSVCKVVTQLNWFYVVAIATLLATVANYFKG